VRTPSSPLTRRAALRLLAAASGTFVLGTTTIRSPMITRSIPSSGERLPVIGLGTWQTFDVGSSGSERQPLEEVLSAFVRLGGAVIDSSPMYGHSEGVLGELAQTLGLRSSLFLATKVWTTGASAGAAQMEASASVLHTRQIDLMQVHNLVDVDTHLATLREWKRAGRIRYIGVTHYEIAAYPRLEDLLRRERLDFLQINYSIAEPQAAERLLPLAQDRGIAVIANRPFAGGELFRVSRGKPLPEWAAEFDCRSWAQFFLKWILSDSRVICAIPATDKVRYLEDNMRGGYGRLPDPATRRRMADFVARM
jgi:diketogulonate reductase-like aldo/keto reductase